MSNTGLAFSWHEDYMNSPYQTSVSSPDKKPAVISLDKAVPTFRKGEERKHPSDSCVIDFDKDGEPSPQDRLSSSLEKMEPTRQKDFLLVPHKRSDLNAKQQSGKKDVHSVRNRSDSCHSEPILVHESAKENPTNSRKESAPDIFISLHGSKNSRNLDPKQAGNLQCQEFMTTPTINNMPPSKKGTGKFRAVMCGNDIMYIPDDDDENSQGSPSPPSGASSPRTSVSYISMEEGDLNPSVLIDDIFRVKSARSNSSGILPCIHLNESMLESLQCEPDEMSEFTFINEMNQKISPSKFPLFENSSLHGQTAETSPPTNKTFLKNAPFTDYISPVISQTDRQFDTPVRDTSDEIQNNSVQDISIDIKEYENWKKQPLKSNSPGLRDTSDEESDDLHMPSDFGQTLKPRRLSISDQDDEEENRQERGRTMVRRSSRIRTPIKKVNEDSDEEDEFNSGLPSPGMTNITITVDHSENTCSSNNSPEKITPYQDNMILEFVNGIITESVKIVQQSKTPTPDEEKPPSNEIIAGDASMQEEATATSAPSVDDEIRMFMKEGNDKFQDSKNFVPSNNTSSQEQKSNAFAQKGWDRLPHDISDAELKAFAEHTILYNEMIRSGRFPPMKSQLDTVREESVPDSSSPDTVLTDPPKTLPKPKPSAVQKAKNTEHTQDIPDSTSSQKQSPKVKTLARDFEEKIQDLEKSPPVCPQNSPKSNSSDSDTAHVKNVNCSLQDIFPVSEGGYCSGARQKEPEKRESFSSGEERPGETESFSSSEGRPGETESQQLPPGIGLSQLFFSNDISPTKDKTSDDMMFMFRLAPESYKKASIVELNDSEKSEADDILQGVPLLEEDDDSNDEDQFQDLFSPGPEYLFSFKTNTDESSSKFKEEATDASTENLDYKNKMKTSKTPPVAQKPVRTTEDTFTPEKPPPIAKKPVRPQQEPPPVAKKPIRPDPSPIIPEKATEQKARMSPSESMPEKTAVNTMSDTETSGKCTVSSVINSVTPKKQSDQTSPVQGLPSVRKPMQEPVSQEISVENQSSVSEKKPTVNESVNIVMESVRPVDKYVDPQEVTNENKILASSLESQASPIKRGDIPGRQAASPVKEQDVMEIDIQMEQATSSAEQVTSLVKALDSSVEQESCPVKEPDSFVEQAFSSVKRPDRLMEQTANSVEELDCSVGDMGNPVKEKDSPEKTSCPVEQATSPEIEPDCPVEQATSPEIEPHFPVEQATSPEIEPDCPVEQATSPEIEPDCPVEQATSPEIEPDCPVEQATSPEIEPDCPVEQATGLLEPDCLAEQEFCSVVKPDSLLGQTTTSPVKKPDSPENEPTSSVRQPEEPVNQGASSMSQTACSVNVQTIPRMEPVKPEKQLDNPENINNINPMNSTATSVSPKMATGQAENESLTTCQQNSSEKSKGLQSTSDPCLTFTDSTGIDVRMEKHMTLEDQTCSQSPINKPLELLGQEEKRLSIDLTDQTDVSEASNVSTYMPAMSSIESEDCWFDSQPDSSETDLLREDSDYERMIAAYKSSQIQNLSTEDDETASNVTLHSDPSSASQSETKSQDGEENAKDSHSNC
ncbi:unnamed protein product [Acanthosepion pharaonis]|uniref:Uncharacterized protein n=1 Tax=Acanthosepion pharaonis TaxID=158019 RepID=A0A812BXA6_ACAPH|nr:unnamed protein product [Sepia pharaonis]